MLYFIDLLTYRNVLHKLDNKKAMSEEQRRISFENAWECSELMSSFKLDSVQRL